MSFSFDAGSYRYPSRRRVVFAGNGMVCASQPLAAQAGVDALRRGGNAVDAVLAAAGCLTVLEPASNGLGGDAFAIVWHNGRMYGLNSSARPPRWPTRPSCGKNTAGCPPTAGIRSTCRAYRRPGPR